MAYKRNTHENGFSQVFDSKILDKRKGCPVFLPYQSFQLLELAGFAPNFYGSAW